MAGTEAVTQGGAGWLVLVGAGIFLLLFGWFWLRMTRYRLSRHEFEVLLVGMVVRRVALSNIDDVFVGGGFPCEFWPCRWIWRGKRLTIRRKRGLLKDLVVTPHDPEQLRINLCYALGRAP